MDEIFDFEPQPPHEKAKLRIGSGVFALLGFAIVCLCLPYELGKPSTILIRNDIVRKIEAHRRQTGVWPISLETLNTKLTFDKTQGQSFKYLSSKQEKEKDIARYSMTVRGQSQMVLVEFDPKSGKKRR